MVSNKEFIAQIGLLLFSLTEIEGVNLRDIKEEIVILLKNIVFMSAAKPVVSDVPSSLVAPDEKMEEASKGAAEDADGAKDGESKDKDSDTMPGWQKAQNILTSSEHEFDKKLKDLLSLYENTKKQLDSE